VLVSAVFLFFWKQNTLFFDPHAPVPVPVPFEWLIVIERFYASFRVRHYRHWYSPNGSFTLLGEHKCVYGAGIVVGLNKTCYDSRSSRFRTGTGTF
jgi:hypothetical protein